MKGWSTAKRTKIVCTIGPASSSPKLLRALILAGMDVARLNFSHGTLQEHGRVARDLRDISEEIGRPLAVLGDLSGPKIRVGTMEEGTVLVPGSLVTLTPRAVRGNPQLIPVSYPNLVREVRVGDTILFADGTLELRVEGQRGEDLAARVVVGGPLGSHKGVNVPSQALAAPALTEKDQRDLRFAVEHDFDLIAQSFVRSPGDIDRARATAEAAGRALPIIAKVEKPQALENLSEILRTADGAMVARGDLGVETPLAQVPGVQKRIIHMANALGKPVITATQMLESMVESPRPTRAEATDVYNAILDGTDAVMLSEESAVGRYPVEAVQVMATIAREADAALEARTFDRGSSRDEPRDAVAAAAVELARAVQAAAIVTPTATGRTPELIARHRPRQPILALGEDPRVLRRLALTWGVFPAATAGTLDLEHLMERSRELLAAEGLPPGSRIVITMGYPPGKAHTNLVLVAEA